MKNVKELVLNFNPGSPKLSQQVETQMDVPAHRFNGYDVDSQSLIMLTKSGILSAMESMNARNRLYVKVVAKINSIREED